MVQIESIKCPNCGAAVRGSGDVTCKYCGSQLRVTGDRSGGAQNVLMVRMGGTKTHAGVTAYFKNLPGAPITTATTSITFQPTVDYGGLPEGKIGPHFEGEAQSIIEVCRQMQRAMNEEDMELYETLVSRANPSFFETALEGARQTFMINDAKRYTTKISFIELNRESAIIDVGNETLSFPEGGAVQNFEMTFRYSMKKEPEGWKIVVSSLSGATKRGNKLFWLIFIIATTLITPLIFLIVFLIDSPGCSGDGKVGDFGETFDKGQETYVDGEYERGTGSIYEVGDMPLVIWSEPSYRSTPLGSVSAPEKVKVISAREDNWVQIERPDGQICWTQADISGENINGNYDGLMEM